MMEVVPDTDLGCLLMKKNLLVLSVLLCLLCACEKKGETPIVDEKVNPLVGTTWYGIHEASFGEYPHEQVNGANMMVSFKDAQKCMVLFIDSQGKSAQSFSCDYTYDESINTVKWRCAEIYYNYVGVVVNNVMYVHAEYGNGSSYKGDFILTQEEQSQEQPSGSRFFSVSATKSVEFAPGNLQYRASTKTWRFAEHQYDYIGADNVNISNSYSGWIDLFGWSTSSSKYGTIPKNSYSYNDDCYEGDFMDWGFNSIQNTAGGWYTLSFDEWSYLLNGRIRASQLYGWAMVKDVKGLILLPDECSVPNTIIFKSGFVEESENIRNKYTLEQWKSLESLGAVFLPAAGYSFGDNTGVSFEQIAGYYWFSNPQGDYGAQYLHFNSSHVEIMSKFRTHYQAVRLVRKVEK